MRCPGYHGTQRLAGRAQVNAFGTTARRQPAVSSAACAGIRARLRRCARPVYKVRQGPDVSFRWAAVLAIVGRRRHRARPHGTIMKTRAAVAYEAGKPLVIEDV